METTPQTLSIQHLKSQAKKLAKEQNLKHAQVLTAIAQTHGFKDWQSLVFAAYKGYIESNKNNQEPLGMNRELVLAALSRVTAEEEDSNWQEKAKADLEEQLEVETTIVREDESDDYFELEGEGRGNNNESEWIVFKDNDAARKYAIQRVKDDLDDDPWNLFNPEFLKKHLMVTDVDKRLIASEEADALYGESSKDDDEIIEDADYAQIEYTDVDDAREKLQEQKSDEVYKALEEDPMGWLKDLYGELPNPLPDFLRLDVNKAAEEAVNVDGVAHFIDHYDGAEVDLVGGAEAYGTN